MTEELLDSVRDAAVLLLQSAGLSEGQIAALERDGYFTAPASKGHHLAEPGGLALHSVNVTNRLVTLSKIWCVPWARQESPYLVGMLHDLVKTRCYAQGDGPDAGKYAWRQPEFRHGAEGIVLANMYGVNLKPCECAAIYHHMGAFCLAGRDLEEYDAALDMWPLEIIATHTADMLASRVDEAKNLPWTGGAL